MFLYKGFIKCLRQRGALTLALRGIYPTYELRDHAESCGIRSEPEPIKRPTSKGPERVYIGEGDNIF